MVTVSHAMSCLSSRLFSLSFSWFGKKKLIVVTFLASQVPVKPSFFVGGIKSSLLELGN